MSLYIEKGLSGVRTGFWQKKSEKYVMPSPMGDVRGLLKELRRIWFLVGGSGGPPPENFLI